jgi:transposase
LHVEPLISPAKRGGNRRTVNVREVVNGLMDILSTGCQWRAMRKDLPPRSTLHDDLELWEWDGTLGRIHHALSVKRREQAGREASLTAVSIDSQSVKSAEKGKLDRPAGLRCGQDDHGQEAAFAGRHRRFAALGERPCVQDRDGGVLPMASLFGLFPFLRKLYADGGYQGPVFQKALARVLPQVNVGIVKRSNPTQGFAVLPKRWIVERTIGWLNRCRRLAKDWENLNRKALAFFRLAPIPLILRTLCNPS